MPAISRPQLAVYAAAAVAILLLGARYLSSSAGGGSGSPTAAHASGARTGAAKGGSVRVEAAGNGLAVVQVAGAVRRPGVYRLRTDRRVDDAVRAAGGPAARADLAGVNLAAKVTDGQQIIVPVAGVPGSAGAAGAGAVAGTAAGPAGGASAPGGAAAGPPLDLNTATPEQLDQLDGVGPATAQKIVAYRQAHGGFRSVNELDQVPGIGEKKLAALKDRLRV